jgi:hypothetical protein
MALPIALVRPCLLPSETTPVARAIRHELPVTAAGVACEIRLDGRWRRGAVTRVQYSAVHVALVAQPERRTAHGGDRRAR